MTCGRQSFVPSITQVFVAEFEFYRYISVQSLIKSLPSHKDKVDLK